MLNAQDAGYGAAIIYNYEKDNPDPMVMNGANCKFTPYTRDHSSVTFYFSFVYANHTSVRV